MRILQTFARFLVPDLRQSVELFEGLSGNQAVTFPGSLAGPAFVGDIALFPRPKQPRGYLGDVGATLLVDDLDSATVTSLSMGATTIIGPEDTAIGRSVIVRNVDETALELIELHPAALTRMLGVIARPGGSSPRAKGVAVVAQPAGQFFLGW
jgi:hypothetical protein